MPTITELAKGAFSSAEIAPSVAAAGSTVADAAALASGYKVYPTSAADGTKGVILASADAYVGNRIIVQNNVGAVLKIYPPTGGTINAGLANAAFSTASGNGVELFCTSASSGGTWSTIG
jgi:hypothetical protein